MMVRGWHLVALLVALVPGLSAIPVAAAGMDHDHKGGNPSAHDHLPTATGEATAAILQHMPDLPRTPVIDHDGVDWAFADALGEGAYILGFTFGQCEAQCVSIELAMRAVDANRDRLDGSLMLLTLTLDPARDTPEILRQMHEEGGAPAGWRRLTGHVGHVMPLLRRLGAWDGGPIDEHRPVFLIGHVDDPQVTRLETRGVDPGRMIEIASHYVAR